MRAMHAFLLLISLFMLGCPLIPGNPPRNITTPEDRAGCEAIGGSWVRMGILGNEGCVLRTSDGGRPCTDGDQCESGACVTDLSIPGGTPAIGGCFGTNTVIGTCMNYVEDGKAQGGLCVD